MICLLCVCRLGRANFFFFFNKVQFTCNIILASGVQGFLCGSADEESACNVGDLGLIPGLGRSPGEGKGYPLHYFGLENSRDCIIHVVVKSQTQLSDFHFQVYNIVIQYFYSLCIYNIINYILCGIHYILVTYLFCNLLFVPFNPFHLFASSSDPPSSGKCQLVLCICEG